MELSIFVDWEDPRAKHGCYFIQVNKTALSHHLFYRHVKNSNVCSWHIIYLVCPDWMCMWIYRPPHNKCCYPQGSKTYCLRTTGTGQAYDWWQWGGPGAHLLVFHGFHPHSPHTASLKRLTLLCLLEMLLCKLQQVSYDFLQQKHFSCKKWSAPWREIYFSGEKWFLLQDPPGLQMCMIVL